MFSYFVLLYACMCGCVCVEDEFVGEFVEEEEVQAFEDPEQYPDFVEGK